MMAKIIWIAISSVLFLPSLFFALDGSKSPDKIALRDMYWAAVEDRDATEDMLEKLEKVDAPDALVLGYRGAAESLMAKHVFNPMNKLDWLKKCDETFKTAVKMDPNNIEIRFLRFAYQHYIPGFLGYSNELEDDRKVLVRELVKQEEAFADDRQLFEDVIAFLLETERCSDAEIAQLNKLKA